MVQKQPAPKAPEVFITEEELTAHLGAITSTINGFCHGVYSLLVCECNPLVLKAILATYGVAFLSFRLGSTGTLFLREQPRPFAH